jgi:hypothetical protein
MTSDARLCPSCGAKRVGFFRYCTSCRHDFEAQSTSARPPVIVPPPKVHAVRRRSRRRVTAPPDVSDLQWGRLPRDEAGTDTIQVRGRSTSRTLAKYTGLGIAGLFGLSVLSNAIGPQDPPSAQPNPRTIATTHGSADSGTDGFAGAHHHPVANAQPHANTEPDTSTHAQADSKADRSARRRHERHAGDRWRDNTRKVQRRARDIHVDGSLIHQGPGDPEVGHRRRKLQLPSQLGDRALV